MKTLDIGAWSGDWAWSLPLIAINVVIHVLCLGVITEQADVFLDRFKGRQRSVSVFAIVMSLTVTLATILHGAEATAWALAYQLLGALPSYKLAMLYSLSAMSSYGNSGTSLPDQWRMMGALESLNGMLLFGLTTAFMFAMIQRIRPTGDPRGERHH